MNREHMELLASDGWRELLDQVILPFALDGLGRAALGDNLLEIGPGPGLTTDLLADLIPSVTCLELDDELAAGLSQRFSSRPDVRVHCGDGSDMPFDDSTFSGVICCTMLHHIPSAAIQDRLFAEAARTVRPGGWFVASDSVASDDLAALHHGDVYNPIDPDGLADRLTAVGFVDVSVRANDFGFACHARRPLSSPVAAT
ncbi:MAG: methyltransferase domain-containing protein [Actinomycetota bacterium]